MESNNQKENIVMTGGSFTTSDDTDSVITSQPRKTSRMETGSRAKAIDAGRTIFDDAHCERDWASGLCQCKGDDKRHCCCYVCCWPYLKYIIATRLGETPFMALIPCAVFALRIKVRTLFGIKGSLVKDFFTSLCCEPCAVCQMNRELDQIGM